MKVKNQYAFYSPDLSQTLVLDDKTVFQILKVLRLKENQMIQLLDGKGKKGAYKIEKIGKDFISVVQISIEEQKEHSDFVLAFGVLKKDLTEWVIQKSVELGASKIFIFQAEHSIAHIKDMDKKKERFQMILKEALEQSGSFYLPELKIYPSLKALIEDSKSYPLYMTDPDSSDTLNSFGLKKKALFIVGPEGGMSPKEIKLLEENNAFKIKISQTVLRAETACISVLSQAVLSIL